jgi:succinyl-diaminopimelate desuccinylase
VDSALDTIDLDLSADAVALTAALVDIASVSGEEKALTDAIERALSPAAHLTVHRDGNTVIARTSLGRAERVVLAGHTDTVPHAGNFPSALNPERTRLMGCGTSDMKSGVAVALRLAAGVREPSRDVTYVFYDCEEVAAERNGLGRVASKSPDLLAGDFAVLMEPSGGVVEGGCQGTLRVAVRTSGARAHTARSWMGDNAIHKAGAILDVLRGYVAREPVVDGLRYHEGLSAVSISGGVATNVVPDACEVQVNYRFAPDLSPAEAIAHVRSLFAGFETEVLDVAPGARPGLDAPIVAAFAAAVGGEPRPKLGWTDVARFAELGMPAVNYGPGIPEIAHTAGEYVELSAITACEERLRNWLAP